MATPPTLPDIGRLTITPPTTATASPSPPFPLFRLPGELRYRVYSFLRTPEEREDRSFRKDCRKKQMYRLPYQTLNAIISNQRLGRDLLGLCYASFEWRATVVIDNIWTEGYRIVPKNTWIWYDSLNANPYNTLNADHLNETFGAIRRVRFAIFHDFLGEAIKRAREEFNTVPPVWRISAVVYIHLNENKNQTPRYVVQAEASIPDDDLGYAERSGSLRAAAERSVAAEVVRLLDGKTSTDLVMRGLMISDWRHLAVFATDTVLNWFGTYRGGWGPLEPSL